METKIIDRSAEKIELAKELGLYGYISFKEQFNLKFKATTWEDAGKKVGSGKIIFKPHINFEAFIIIMICIGISLLSTLNHSHSNVFFETFVYGGSLLTAMCFILFDKVVSTAMLLERWKSELPYGALLAAKEAQEQGISEFHIVYPILQSKRLLEDPVIVGFKDSIMYEIFAWDDGKVYE